MATLKYCKKCNRKNTEGFKYCPDCGSYLVVPEEKTQQEKYFIENGVLKGYIPRIPPIEGHIAIIPSSVTSIASRVFESKGVRRLILPKGLKKIGSYAFYEAKVETIKLPDSLEIIGMGAFERTDIKDIDIPSNVTKIEPDTFRSCKSLTNVDLHSGLIEIDGFAFSGCPKLTSIRIPKTIKKIADWAFYLTPIKDIFYAGTKLEFTRIEQKFDHRTNRTEYMGIRAMLGPGGTATVHCSNCTFELNYDSPTY